MNWQITVRCHSVNTHCQQKTLSLFSEPLGTNNPAKICQTRHDSAGQAANIGRPKRRSRDERAFLFRGNFSYTHPGPSALSRACLPGHGHHANNESTLTLHLCLQLPIKSKLNCFLLQSCQQDVQGLREDTNINIRYNMHRY